MKPNPTQSAPRRDRARSRPANALGVACALALGLAGPGAIATASAEAERLQEAVGVVTEGNRESVEVQRTIDTLSDEADAMASEYRAILDQIDDVEAYVDQVERLIEAQGDEVEKLRNEIDEVEVIGRGIPALMGRMVEALDEFVELDIPFLLDDRQKRVLELRRLLARSDVTDAEKFRRILEAYQIENEFGRTIEAYRGTLDTGGEERTVDFLRIGRIALLYQTNDTTEAGAWSVPDGTWVRLGDREHNAIRQGLRIASKQAAPDLISVPLPRPVDVASEDGRTR
jgi:hypothetical protein